MWAFICAEEKFGHTYIISYGMNLPHYFLRPDLAAEAYILGFDNMFGKLAVAADTEGVEEATLSLDPIS